MVQENLTDPRAWHLGRQPFHETRFLLHTLEAQRVPSFRWWEQYQDLPESLSSRASAAAASRSPSSVVEVSRRAYWRERRPTVAGCSPPLGSSVHDGAVGLRVPGSEFSESALQLVVCSTAVCAASVLCQDGLTGVQYVLYTTVSWYSSI